MRRRALSCAAAGLVVAAIVPAASAGSMRTSALPVPLTGTWTRTVSKADVTRTQGAASLIGAVCTFTVKAGGTAHIACTGSSGAEFGGYVVAAGHNRVHLNLGIPSPDVYSWLVAGQTLTLTKVSDTVPDRVAVFVGVWKRK